MSPTSEMSESEQQLKTIQQKIMQGEFKPAYLELKVITDKEPENAEALYMLSVCQRYLGELTQALQTLEQLKRLLPGNGRAHQEEGHVFRALNKADNALRAYARACYYNPALEVSFKAQIELLQSAGATEQCNVVKKQLDELQALPRPLIAIIDLIAQNKLIQAEDIARKFLMQNPRHVRAMRLLADIGMRLGVLDDAEFLLESAVEFEPDNVEARVDYIQALRKRQKFFKALDEAEYLLKSEPENPRFRSIYAVECMQAGRFDEAVSQFKKILETLPDDPGTLTSLGHAFKTTGDYEAAVDSYAGAIKAHPYHGEAYYSLANLKTYKFDDGEIAAMQALLANSNIALMDKVYVNFALGKAFEDQQNYKQSFQHYEAGNALKKAQSRYQSQLISEEFAAQKRVCDKALMDRGKEAGCQNSDPIFILGLPRAGSTLLEQILSSHSQVDGTLELPNILSLSQKLRRRQRKGGANSYPEILAELGSEELRQFGEEYIADTRIHRQGAAFFIDKMPNNFRHIGLIKLILPNARIIDARRNPMDCCFSGFKQLFADGQEFSYSLSDIGQYYRDYVDLMAHWESVLPGEVHRVRNEDLIDNFEDEVRKLLEFCGLPFEEACLRFYETERNIRTPSSEQVRKPINRSGVGQWLPFEEYLEPLKEALGDLVVTEQSSVNPIDSKFTNEAVREIP